MATLKEIAAAIADDRQARYNASLYEDAAEQTAISIQLALEAKIETTNVDELREIDDLLAGYLRDFERQTNCALWF